CLPTSNTENVYEQRLLHWYNSIKPTLGNESIRSASGSFLSNSPLTAHHNSTDYNKYLLSQVNSFPPDEPILSSTVCDRLSTSTPTQIFQTQNRTGLYQLC
ncbi:unnamed protein product, partial [Rotaria sordida]